MLPLVCFPWYVSLGMFPLVCGDSRARGGRCGAERTLVSSKPARKETMVAAGTKRGRTRYFTLYREGNRSIRGFGWVLYVHSGR